MKRFLFSIASAILYLSSFNTYGKQCDSRILDPEIAGFLKKIGYKDLTLEQIRYLPIEQIKYSQIP